jgi:hypothetical protein
VADTKVVLIDEQTGRVAARAVTDARGHFVFRNVPANQYEFRVIGPWKIAEFPSYYVLAGEASDDNFVLVIPGALQPDPDAPPGSDPLPQAGVAPPAAGRLATTGATVIELAIVGLVALAMGLSMVLVFARRRRA